MELKTPSGQAIDPKRIDYIFWGKTVSGIPGTLVQLKTGEEVFLDNSEEEVIREMNKIADQSAIDCMTGEAVHLDILGLH
jgi:hypothetical protein